MVAGSIAATGCATYPNQYGYDPYYNNGYNNGYTITAMTTTAIITTVRAGASLPVPRSEPSEAQ